MRGQYLLTLLFRYEIKVCTLDTVRSNGYNRNSMLRRSGYVYYMTAQEAAEKWNVLCVGCNGFVRKIVLTE